MNYLIYQTAFSRYLCGGESLKSARHISRELTFATDSNIVNHNAARDLVRSISKYKNATNYFCKNKISSETIKNAHRIICPTYNHAGIIRSQPILNRVKKDHTTLPKPSDLSEFIDQSIELLNKRSPNLFNSVQICSKLLWAHPFKDGNGRLTRALFDSISINHELECIPIFIYILSNNAIASYMESLKYSKDDENFSKTIFWQEYSQWNQEKLHHYKLITDDAKYKIMSNFILFNIGEAELNIINSLWTNPIINPETIYGKLESHEKLAHIGILEKNRFNNKFGFIYISNLIMEVYAKIDTLIIGK